jgi:hypothetical protein
VHYAGNASTKPKIEISYKEKGVERPTRVSRDLVRSRRRRARRRVVARRTV